MFQSNLALQLPLMLATQLSPTTSCSSPPFSQSATLQVHPYACETSQSPVTPVEHYLQDPPFVAPSCTDRGDASDRRAEDGVPGRAIPHSVKGAPAHLRPVIRKLQNSESAKRSRQRRKEAAGHFYERFNKQCQRISSLEKRVAQLSKLVALKQKKVDEEAENLNDERALQPEEMGGDVAMLPRDVEEGAECGSAGSVTKLSAEAIAFEEDLDAFLSVWSPNVPCFNCAAS